MYWYSVSYKWAGERKSDRHLASVLELRVMEAKKSPPTRDIGDMFPWHRH